MSAIKNNLLSIAKHAKRSLKKRDVQRKFLHADVPYFSQWESPKLVEKILNKEIPTDQDPNWKSSGAITKEEYVAWSWTGCGMACTKMLVAHLKDREVPLVELGKQCAEYGGYTLPIEDSAGLIYSPFVTFAKKDLGLDAKVVLPLLIPEITEELSAENYIIASVSPKIRHPSDKPAKKGGHLILLLGYDLDEQLLFFHNPSGFFNESQEYASVSFADFKKFFSGRGIVVQG